MTSRTIVLLFPRNRYRGGTTATRYYTRERLKMAKLLGTATKVAFHTRVYDRAANASLTFEISHGCLGNELPGDAARVFLLTLSSTTPGLPYDATNMPNLPDDGTMQASPVMGLVDVAALVSGGANVWAEFEQWATLEFNS